MVPLTGYTACKALTISKTNAGTEASSDFPVLVCVASDAQMAICLTSGYDVRFTASDGTTPLYFHRRAWAGGNGTAVTAHWFVKVTTISVVADTVIYMHYGKVGDTDASDADNTYEANYKGVWPLDETGTVTTWADASGTGNDGTNAGATAGTGKIGGAGVFNGTTQYISVTDSVSLTYQNVPFSISCWFKTSANASTNGNGLVDKRALPGANYSYKLAYFNNKIYFARYDGTNNPQIGPGNTLVNDGAWHYVVAVRTAAGKMDLYVDGASDATEITDTSNNPNAAVPVHIGRESSSGAWNYFPGSIDEVRISATGRSASWVKFSYYNQKDADGGTFGSGQNQITIGAEERLGGPFPHYCRRLLSGGMITMGV